MPMRSLFYIIIGLVLVGCSCSGTSDVRDLDNAERLLLEDPAAAMAKLNEYDVSCFNDSSIMARWALLYSEALVANRITAPTDTIVNIAIEYYGSKDDRERLLHATGLKTLLLHQDQDNDLASALYLQKEKEYMLYKERMRKEQILWIALAVLLGCCGIIIWQRKSLKIKRMQSDMLMSEASCLKDEISRQQDVCNRLEHKLEDSIRGRFNTLDDLCCTYYESSGTKAQQKAIVEKVRQQIDSIRNDNELFLEMEKAVNDCRNDMLVKFREALPELKPEEYRLMVYLASNLSSRTIALLIGESMDVVYKRKSRLKKRIASTDNIYSDLFLSVF